MIERDNVTKMLRRKTISHADFCAFDHIMASDDNFSDLTDLESDEYVDTKSSRKKSTAKSGGKSGYRIKNALKPPRATTYTAQALYGNIFLSIFLGVRSHWVLQSKYFRVTSISNQTINEV